MAYTINDDCICCGKCLGECPVDAISSGDNKYEINQDICTDCGRCVSECEPEAIEEG